MAPSTSAFSNRQMAEEIVTMSMVMENQARQSFIDAMNQAADDPDLIQIIEEISAGNYVALTPELMNRIDLLVINTTDLQRIMADAFAKAGQISQVSTQIALSFSLFNPRAVEYLRSFGVEIQSITASVKENLKNLLQKAIEGEMGRAELRRLIKKQIGLLPQHTDAVDRYLANLLSQGMSIRQAKKLAANYTDRLLSYRATMIARTEIGRAVGFGQWELWQQALEQNLVPQNTQRVWITAKDEMVCDICRPMDGEIAEIDGPWYVDGNPVMIPEEAHPQCRCSSGLVFPTSLSKADPIGYEMWLLKKGDFPGHPFRGNQHTGGIYHGSAGKKIKVNMSVDPAGSSVNPLEYRPKKPARPRLNSIGTQEEQDGRKVTLYPDDDQYEEYAEGRDGPVEIDLLHLILEGSMNDAPVETVVGAYLMSEGIISSENEFYGSGQFNLSEAASQIAQTFMLDTVTKENVLLAGKAIYEESLNDAPMVVYRIGSVWDDDQLVSTSTSYGVSASEYLSSFDDKIQAFLLEPNDVVADLSLSDWDGEKERLVIGSKLRERSLGFVDKPFRDPSEIKKGDFVGHPFRGNQHTGGIYHGSAGTLEGRKPKLSDKQKAVKETLEALKLNPDAFDFFNSDPDLALVLADEFMEDNSPVISGTINRRVSNDPSDNFKFEYVIEGENGTTVLKGDMGVGFKYPYWQGNLGCWMSRVVSASAMGIELRENMVGEFGSRVGNMDTIFRAAAEIVSKGGLLTDEDGRRYFMEDSVYTEDTGGKLYVDEGQYEEALSIATKYTEHAYSGVADIFNMADSNEKNMYMTDLYRGVSGVPASSALVAAPIGHKYKVPLTSFTKGEMKAKAYAKTNMAAENINVGKQNVLIKCIGNKFGLLDPDSGYAPYGEVVGQFVMAGEFTIVDRTYKAIEQLWEVTVQQTGVFNPNKSPYDVTPGKDMLPIDQVDPRPKPDPLSRKLERILGTPRERVLAQAGVSKASTSDVVENWVWYGMQDFYKKKVVKRPNIKKGDYVGHPFRGNQHTGGIYEYKATPIDYSGSMYRGATYKLSFKDKEVEVLDMYPAWDEESGPFGNRAKDMYDYITENYPTRYFLEPDVIIEQFARDIFDTTLVVVNEDGDEIEITAEVNNVGIRENYQGRLTLEVTGWIEHSSSSMGFESERGYFERDLVIEADPDNPQGTLSREVNNISLQIGEGSEGLGLGSALIRHWEDQYSKAGFGKMTVSAQSGLGMNGAWTWLKTGYEPSEGSYKEAMRNFLNDKDLDSVPFYKRFVMMRGKTITDPALAKKAAKVAQQMIIEIGKGSSEQQEEKWRRWRRNTLPMDSKVEEFWEELVNLHLLDSGSEANAYLKSAYTNPNFKEFLSRSSQANWYGSKETSIIISKKLTSAQKLINAWMLKDPVGLENDDPKFVKQLMKAIKKDSRKISKGDFVGHPFRGNQWTGGIYHGVKGTLKGRRRKAKEEKIIINRSVGPLEPDDFNLWNPDIVAEPIPRKEWEEATSVSDGEVLLDIDTFHETASPRFQLAMTNFEETVGGTVVYLQSPSGSLMDDINWDSNVDPALQVLWSFEDRTGIAVHDSFTKNVDYTEDGTKYMPYEISRLVTVLDAIVYAKEVIGVAPSLLATSSVLSPISVKMGSREVASASPNLAHSMAMSVGKEHDFGGRAVRNRNLESPRGLSTWQAISKLGDTVEYNPLAVAVNDRGEFCYPNIGSRVTMQGYLMEDLVNDNKLIELVNSHTSRVKQNLLGITIKSNEDFGESGGLQPDTALSDRALPALAYEDSTARTPWQLPQDVASRAWLQPWHPPSALHPLQTSIIHELGHVYKFNLQANMGGGIRSLINLERRAGLVFEKIFSARSPNTPVAVKSSWNGRGSSKISKLKSKWFGPSSKVWENVDGMIQTLKDKTGFTLEYVLQELNIPLYGGGSLTGKVMPPFDAFYEGGVLKEGVVFSPIGIGRGASQAPSSQIESNLGMGPSQYGMTNDHEFFAESFELAVGHGYHRVGKKPFPSLKALNPKSSVRIKKRAWNPDTDTNPDNFWNPMDYRNWNDVARGDWNGNDAARGEKSAYDIEVPKILDKYETVSTYEVMDEFLTEFGAGMAETGKEGAIDRDGDGKIFDGTPFERPA